MSATRKLTLPLLLALVAAPSSSVAQTHDHAPIGPCIDVPASTAVTFADANLAAAVRTALELPEGAALTCGQVGTITELAASSAGIESLSGIESLTGLTTVDFDDNSISDLGPLASLPGLTDIWLGTNRIRDVTPLSALTGLTRLGLRDNQIVDIGPLAALTRMIDLNITFNEISDLSALRAMTEMTTLRLYNNPIRDISALEDLTKLQELHIHDLPTLSNVQPLLDNPGVGEGDQFPLYNSGISCDDVAALRAKGVSVGGTCLVQAIGFGGWAILVTFAAIVLGAWGYRRTLKPVDWSARPTPPAGPA